MTKPAPSLAEFAAQKKRSTCVVCQLPADTRGQLKEAGSRKIRRAVMVEWLVSLGHKVTSAHLDAHYSGRHDVETAA